jgi:threonine synthase
MKLYSTKNKSYIVELREAVLKGLPPDNGLYMPCEINPLPKDFIENIKNYTFQEIAFRVAKNMIGDYISNSDLEQIVNDSINFDAPLEYVDENISFLELFHGNTLAFKDFGARFMARIMGYFMSNKKEEVTILVATSGDTGSAVAQGFYNVEGIKVVVLYPKGKVSKLQEKQFATLGGNISVVQIDGTFDDCQYLVKSAFLDEELNKNMTLSSANSINIARLIPQSFYYFNAYRQLENTELPLYFSVPSGNFGNLTAGLFAWKMGLPITNMIASNNANDEFKRYTETGNFNPRPSVSTISNAMDVGNPSNFWRIMDIYDNDLEKVKADISAYSFNDKETEEAIRFIYNNYHYITCPHTAVGYLGLDSFIKDHHLSKNFNGIVLSTAHPVKFREVVEPAIGCEVPLPQKLEEMMKKEVVVNPMSSNFEEFKAYLLSS